MKMGSKRYKSDHYEDAAAKTCVRLVHKEIVLKPTVKHEEGLQVCGYVPQGEGDEKSDYIIARVKETVQKRDSSILYNTNYNSTLLRSMNFYTLSTLATHAWKVILIKY